MNQINACCAECGVAGGVSLKVCKSCMDAKYCNAECQKKHWATHKAVCKLRAAELRDEALFKDPPPKEDCPICFLPMPVKLVCCMSLPPATITSVPIFDYVKNEATEELANMGTEEYYECCGKSICRGCLDSFGRSGNIMNCPHCKSMRIGLSDEDIVKEMMKRVEANDAKSMYVLGNSYDFGEHGLQQDHEKASELWKQAAGLGSSQAHYHLGNKYLHGGNMKKAKFHLETAAMAGHEEARSNLGLMEAQSGNMERAVKHWAIASSAGNHQAMNNLLVALKRNLVPQDEFESALTAYNNSCVEMRSEARDAFIASIAAR